MNKVARSGSTIRKNTDTINALMALELNSRSEGGARMAGSTEAADARRCRRVPSASCATCAERQRKDDEESQDNTDGDHVAPH